MKRVVAQRAVAALVLVVALMLPAQAAVVAPPRLAVVVVVDQFPMAALARIVAHRPRGAFARLLATGRGYRARYGHASTFTASGHALLFSGASAGRSGIVGNGWYDRRNRRHVYCVEDPDGLIVESELERRDGRGPAHLRVDTLADLMVRRYKGRGNTVALSLKDRGAILPAGKRARAVIWYSTKEAAWVTSQAYSRSLPRWVGRRNEAEKELWQKRRVWTPLPEVVRATGKRFAYELGSTPRHPPTGKQKDTWLFSAHSQEALFALASEALATEALGKDATPDLLMISVSTTDLIGHRYGQEAPETLDVHLRLDDLLAAFWAQLEQKVGPGRYTLAIVSDHGAAPMPQDPRRRIGRLAVADLADRVRAALRATLGDYPKGRPWLEAYHLPNLYLSRMVREGSPARYAAAFEAVRRALLAHPSVHEVYDARSLPQSDLSRDPVGRAVLKSIDPERSGDFYVVWKPGWLLGSHGTYHGTPWYHDTDVPFLLWGAGVRPAGAGATARDTSSLRQVAATAIAPTLARLLQLPALPGAESPPIDEALSR